MTAKGRTGAATSRTSALSTTLPAFAAEHVRGRRLSIDQSINQSINQLINHAFLDWSK